MYNSIQFSYDLLTCQLQSTTANYEASTKEMYYRIRQYTDNTKTARTQTALKNKNDSKNLVT